MTGRNQLRTTPHHTQGPHGSIALFKWPECISMANERGRGSPLGRNYVLN